MASWTVKFADRTDGVIMLGDIGINMKPIPADGLVVSQSFTLLYCCYTSDNEITVNNNSFTLDTSDGNMTVKLSVWKPNSTQMDIIRKNPNIKKYNYFFNIEISGRTGNNPIVTFNPDITVVAPEPPKPVEKKYNLLDSVPAGYDVKGDYDYGSGTFADLDVSQLKYDKGDKLPTFSLVMKDGYEYDVETWTRRWESGDDPYLASSNLSSYYITGEDNQPEEPPYLWITFYADDYASLPDELVQFGNVPTPTVVATHYTVQLDLLNCTADKPTVSTVNEGDSYTVNFTANDGYVFNEQPYVQIGSEIVYADVTDPSHASITITNITQNLTIIAHATEPEPVDPTEELPFVNIYNPTQAQLVDAANKLFMNFDTGNVVNISPYIVSIHKVFVPVSTDAEFQPIKFGKYNTQVNSKVVNQKVSRVSCGKVRVPELYHNALDYSPFTTVRIWLPFLGFYDLSIDELSNKEIELTYAIDLVNGKALAEISNDDGVIYRFVGTAYAQEPYHTESLNNMSTAYINGAYNMADFTPYLLIERPINLTPSNNDLEGLPTYKVVTIGDMKGYLRCRKVFATDMIATEAEKNEIEALLRDGVLVD